ncbi:Tetratricopeptide repeat-containing protein [Granulicella pectinivorans]|uniref:Tetratricopeptide repeat-containing protein n=2 Tax=Granulicella pectinivorans TaxID=474950 RepID=A0A1I6MDM2_9BACT|nr:Tetratricopeptide repeat-containing protein [Granulicella pectinivorans]
MTRNLPFRQHDPRTLRIVAMLLILVAAGVLAMRMLHVPAAHASEDGVAARKAYHRRIASKYFAHFDDAAPFLPSNATTDTGEFIDPKSVPTAAYCGHCHQESHKQWRQSAHANAFRTPWYQKNVKLLMDTKGVEYARHCEGCHNPVALTSGSMTPGTEQKRAGDEDGVTCAVCHSIRQGDTRGTGSYVLSQPAVLMDEEGKPIYGKVTDAEILAHLDRHSAAVMQPFMKSPEFCASCHKAALPKTLNDYKWQRALFVYDEWQMSSFAKRSPLPFYVKDSVSTCQTCHMSRESLSAAGPDARDPGAKHGELASHRWIGANTLIPSFYKYDVQLAKTKAFLAAGVFNVDLFSLEVKGKPTAAPLGDVPVSVAPGDLLTATVVIQNKGAAHSHVPEQRDMYESWVEFKVMDAAGMVLTHSGYLKPDGELDERAHSFTNRLINAQGTLNDKHQVWTNRIVAYNNTIQSGRSQSVRYQFRVPETAKSPLSMTAEVKYHRFNQHFIDWAMSTKDGVHVDEPMVTMAARTRTIAIGTTPPDAKPAADVKPIDNPAWMRWNNYGIALLDAQQYAESAAAFAKVAAIRPDYADAFTNIALADFQWQHYDDSRAALKQALRLSPGNARALYYLSLIERNEGNLDAAVDDLKKVVEKFPDSRDAHRELGFSYYQQHHYDLAKDEYERLQAIDPDDLAAHYNLSLIYRRLGMKEKAAIEAARFNDQKDDPAASAFAFDYLRSHSELSQESTPWHTHSDSAP